jgi:hypothetical protein
MPELSFEEIKNGGHFEDLTIALTIAYFDSLKNVLGPGISQVQIMGSGVGPDGGKDIIVIFNVTDLSNFKRKWVVQCKFLERNVSASDINDVHIPQLLYSLSACGYLLICKQKPTSKLVNHFEDLNENCKEKYSYLIWTGEEFKRKLYEADKAIHKQFFPKYHEELCKIENKIP